jgi:serine phosphatase RsbU (regulator of sigma subunit)
MSFVTTINNLVSPQDKLNPDDERKGIVFLYSMLVFISLMVVGLPFLLLVGYGGDDFIVAVITTPLLFFGLIWFYTRYGYRVIIVNLINSLGHLSTFTLYEYSGGIYSSENVFPYMMCAWIFLVGNKWSGYIWFAIVMLTQVFLYFAEINEWHAFLPDMLKLGPEYILANLLSSGMFLCIVVSLYESGKNKYVKQLVDSKLELDIQKKELLVQKEDIVASINYAKKIQQAILPFEEVIIRNIPLSFILYKPRDIVSGDFYWFHELNRDEYILVCADCTGHGVPGAFMTVIGSNLLNQIVVENKLHDPSLILKELDMKITSTLKQEKERTLTVQDGMDCGLIRVNKAKKEFIYCGAKRSAFFISNSVPTEIKASKLSIGGLRSGEKTFESTKVSFETDDMIYLYTDGYPDQFGGEKAKKYSSKRLKEDFIKIHNEGMSVQKQRLENNFEYWKGNLEQIDDVCVIGIRF